MGINDTREILTASLPIYAFANQIIILCKKDSIQGGGTIQQGGVLQFLRMIFLCGEDIHTTQPQANGNGIWHVYVHVEMGAQVRTF